MTRSCKGFARRFSEKEETAEYARFATKPIRRMQGWFPKGITPFPFYGEVCKAVEWWDGIGGQMVLGRQRQTVVKKPSGTGLEKKKVSRGTAKMAAAADKALEDNSKTIVDSLTGSAKKGNATCTKLLLALADGQIDCEDEVVMERLCSYAEKLAAEPQWKGPEPEPDDE